MYQSHRQQLSGSAPVALSRVLAAKPDLLTVEKTNSAAVRENTQCSVNKVLIGKVRMERERVVYRASNLSIISVQCM